MQELAPDVWQARETAHQLRVDAMLAGHRERAGTGRTHPVEDFLFTYYSFRPARLRRWHPGPGVVLLGAPNTDREGWRDYRRSADNRGVTMDLAAFGRSRAATLDYVLALLAATADRPANLGCFGLHEWAMVYRQDAEQVRHTSHPLRLGATGTDAVVEASRIRCTHHDAFRFFTGPARPLNALQPAREDQVALEQPGCLHATMDLYKWAYKLTPGLPSELVADCFELTRRTRELDMRASPYDLAGLGYEPVRIETASGRADYVARQRDLTTEGQALRGRFLAAGRALQQACSAAGQRRGTSSASRP